MTDQRSTPAGSVDVVDLDRYERLGAAWWDERGPMGKLHEINPVRLRYLCDIIGRRSPPTDATQPLKGLTLLDVGCGGGLLSEPLARLGGLVTGIDPAPGNIAIAQAHATAAGLVVDYRATTAEVLAATAARFDVVVALEVVEHVTDRPAFVGTLASLVAPGGLLVLSTLNRTAKSFVLAIVGAEYVLRWLPRGTHRWTQFVTPTELAADVRRSGLAVISRKGLVYDPLRRDWRLADDTDVNYFMAAGKPPSA